MLELVSDTQSSCGWGLHLRNKTFVNAHLIKYGLADVDAAKDYKYKSNFLNYGRLT